MKNHLLFDGSDSETRESRTVQGGLLNQNNETARCLETQSLASHPIFSQAVVQTNSNPGDLLKRVTSVS